MRLTVAFLIKEKREDSRGPARAGGIYARAVNSSSAEAEKQAACVARSEGLG